MNMVRIVVPELLDSLPEDHPDALRSRRDLRRVHLAMGTRGILLRALGGWRTSCAAKVPLRLLELGAGDGTVMLGVAQALRAHWPAVELTLLDRQRLVTPATLAAYARLGWSASVQVADVLDWALADSSHHAHSPTAQWDAIVTNLFVHHFEGRQLTTLLAAIEKRTERFLACEPRRARLVLAGSHLIGVIGANAVTRKDAVLSVHAGFRGRELSTLWPGRPGQWTVAEYSAGPFSHCFCAQRNPVDAAAAS